MRVKQTGRLALAGVLSALALVLLLFTYIPTATLALAALAAVCGMPVVIELGIKAGLYHYAAVAVLAALLAFTAEGTGLYVAFFGWYTVLKAFLERRSFAPVIEWGIKLAAFLLAITAYGAVWVWVLSMPLPAWFDWWMLAPLALAAAVVFVIYDRALTGVVTVYHQRIRPKIQGVFHF